LGSAWPVGDATLDLHQHSDIDDDARGKPEPGKEGPDALSLGL